MEESQLVSGVAFKKTFSYAGFEMQPKCYDKPKICMLNVELELKAERDNAEIRVDSVQVCVRVCACVSDCCACMLSLLLLGQNVQEPRHGPLAEVLAKV